MPPRQLQDVLCYLRRTVSPPGSRHVSDAELLARFVQQQDDAAFESLLWRHGKMVLSTCRRILRDRPEAEDAFQATFLALARRAGSIGKRASVGGWLYRVAYRMALAAREELARRSARERPLVELPAADAEDPAAAAAWREIRLIIDDEVNRLIEIYRVPLILCYFEGKTNAEAARELGCAVGTIESRLTRARERLRVRLSRRGLTLSAGTLAAALVHEGARAAVPAVLFDFTSRAAVAFAASQATAGISMRVATLSEGVLRAMFLTKLKVAALLLAVAIGAAGVGVLWHPARAVSPAGDKQANASQPEPAAARAGDPAEKTLVNGVIKQVDAARRTVTLQVNTLAFDNSWANANAQWQNFTLPEATQFRPLTIRAIDAASQTITIQADQFTAPATTWLNTSPQWQNYAWSSQWQNYALPYVPFPGTNQLSSLDLANAQLLWSYQRPAYVPWQNNVAQISSQEVKHKLTPRAKIIIDGKEARLIDLKPNTPVQLTLDKQGLVTRVEANGSTMEQCFVRSFDFTKHVITVRHFTNNIYQYELAPDARVDIDGRDSVLTELKADMALTLRFSAVKPKEVISLSTRGPDISVVLKAVNVNGRTITLRLPKEHLTAADVPVAEDAGIVINGKEAGLADLKPGMQLVLHMAADPEKSLVMGIRAGQGK